MSANLNATTANPLDRNNDGRVNLKDLAPGAGTHANTGLGAHHNPLDRNHDGRVNLADVRPLAATTVAPGTAITTTTTTTTQSTGLGLNPLDRNHDGIVNARDLAPNAGARGLNSGLGLGAQYNPLDRNHDGRVDQRDLNINAGLGQGSYMQSTNRASIGLVRAEPTIIETIQKDVVVHERIHPVQKEEIQPIIYREREQLDVKQVTQMLHETQIQPTIIQQRELPAERREAIVERAAPIAENYIAPRSEIDATLRSQVVHAPIINEVIKKTIIEEIQPVLERDIIQSTVIQNTQPIYEKIVEAPTVYRETIITNQDRGIVGGSLEALAAQGFNLGTFTAASSGLTTTGTVLPANFVSGNTTGLTTTTNTTYVNTSGNRRSLAEALPASYSHLSSGNLTTDAKLAESELLRRQQADASLGAKNTL